jgi:hypothetical protein
MRSDALAGALSWCNIQVWFTHNSGLSLRTASLKRAKIFCITKVDTNNYTVTFGKGTFHFRFTLTLRDSVAYAGNNQQSELKYKGKTSKVLHLEHSFLWCWKVHTAESRPEISGKFLNVVLEKNGEDHCDRLCEKRRSATQSQGGNKSATDNTKTED